MVFKKSFWNKKNVLTAFCKCVSLINVIKALQLEIADEEVK
jgi:hypothetical protein